MSKLEATKFASERYANYYGDIRRHLAGDFAAEVRWLTASLFALNAGGLAAISGIKLRIEAQVVSGALFWIGILAAFSLVLYSQSKTKAFIRAVSGIEEHYVLAAATGDVDVEKIAELEAAKRAVKSGLSTPIAIASFAMFTAGLVAIGILGTTDPILSPARHPAAVDAAPPPKTVAAFVGPGAADPRALPSTAKGRISGT